MTRNVGNIFRPSVLYYGLTMSGKVTKAQKLNSIVYVKENIDKIYITQASKN